MNITNRGKKIINIGSLALLPGNTAPLPKEYEGNPVIGFFIKRGTLVCDQPFQSNAAQTPLNDDAEAAVRAEAEARDKAETAKAKEIEEATRSIKKMNRAELDAACAEAGIQVEEGDTVPTLQQKLIAKLQEG